MATITIKREGDKRQIPDGKGICPSVCASDDNEVLTRILAKSLREVERGEVYTMEDVFSWIDGEMGWNAEHNIH